MLSFPGKIANNLSKNPLENIYMIVKETKKIIECSYCFYYKISDTKTSLEIITSDMATNDRPITTDVNGQICFKAITSGDKKPLSIIDIEKTKFATTDNTVLKYKLKTYLSVLIQPEGKVIGCLAIADTSLREFSIDDEHTLESLALLIGLQEQYKASLELVKKSDYKYSAIFENANDCIVLLNNQEIVDINDKGCQMFGYDKEEIIGMSPSELSPKVEGELTEDNQNKTGYLDAALDGIPQHFEWMHEKKDGTIFYTDISLTRLDNSKIYNSLAIIRDISKQKQYEKELIEASEKATESNRMKSLSLASMSHELRTPLNSIIGFSDLLLDEDTTEEEKEMFSKLIQTAGRSLMQLIGDIVDISKIEAGQVTIQKSMFNVNSFLQEILLTFKQEKEIRGKTNIELKLVLSDKASDLRIETDPHRLQQIFNNLLTNSLKFVDDGFIEFGYLSIAPEYIQFYVKDTGVGIETNKKDKIFEQYGQDKSTYSRNLEGTGLGLAISKSFVELLGGNIWLDSEIDEGSTFYFTIPFEAKTGFKDFYLNQSLIGSDNWSQRTILIADDVKDNYIFLKGVLSHTGVNILWAQNGEEAVNLCKSDQKVDIVLMDIKMPIMDGLLASKLIKKENPDIVIIAQTAFASADDRNNCLESGCDQYFKKPINHEKLFSVIAEYFN